MNEIPHEILERILSDPVLTEKDVVNFSSISSEFRNAVTSSNVIWKQKFFQRWQSPKYKNIVNVDNWMEEFISRVKIEKKTLELLSEMSPKFYSLEELSDTDLKYVNDFVNSTSNSYFYIAAYLKQINCLTVQNSMTISYYSEKLFNYIKKNHLHNRWHELQGLENRLQTLEKGAIFVGDWFQTNYESRENLVVQHLNTAADLVKKVVKEKHKDHPLNSVSEETFSKWRNENIPDNMFQPQHCKEILDCINYVLFIQLHYCPTYGTGLLHLSFTINSAIFERRTTPLILGVIYESISRRLGVRCEIIVFPAHCLLRWKEEYRKENSPYHYIDMRGREIFLKPKCCPRNAVVVSQCPIEKPKFQPCNMQRIARITTQDLLRADRVVKLFNSVSDVLILELLLMFSPTSVALYRDLGRCYMRNKMDISDLIKKMMAINPQALTREARPMYELILSKFHVYVKNREEAKSKVKQRVKSRTKEIEFAVGMIGRHKILNYTCVVYGWDPLCKASQNWIQLNGVPNLLLKDNQPFYYVLADGGMEDYVAQENLQLNHCPPLIFHSEIGRYFEEYCTTYYKPNQQLQQEYPEDAAALQKLLFRTPGTLVVQGQP